MHPSTAKEDKAQHRQHANEILELAVEIGYKVGVELAKENSDQDQLADRFRALHFTLKAGNPDLRLSLLSGLIQPENFVKMSEEDLADD